MQRKGDNMIFTSNKESQFFTKSEYEFIGHDFNFEALGKLTSPKFAEKIKDSLYHVYIKKFTFKEGEEHFFLKFYAEDGIEKEKFVVISAYHNKAEYFSIDVIDKRTFSDLGLDITLSSK